MACPRGHRQARPSSGLHGCGDPGGADAEGAVPAAAAGRPRYGRGSNPSGRVRLAGAYYSTLSRRQQDLTVAIPYSPRDRPLHLVINSTGLKVLGEGEWKVRKHGADKRRMWRKVHLVIDGDRR